MNKANLKQAEKNHIWMDMYIVAEYDSGHSTPSKMAIGGREALSQAYPWLAGILPSDGDDNFFRAEVTYGAKRYNIWQAD